MCMPLNRKVEWCYVMLNRSGKNTDITCISDKYSQNRYNLIDLGGSGLKKTAKTYSYQ